MADPVPARLITLDPAHFHAALVQKQMLPGIAPRVAIYAPLSPDLLAHLRLIEQFNSRPDNPTHWELDIHCSSHSLAEMLAAPAGNVVVLAGHNRTKIEKIKSSLAAGLNVLADKPWIIRAEDFTALEATLSLADQKRLVAFDMMTERHEITSILQREMVSDPAVFGTLIPADPSQPGVFMESTHFILKTVAGTPNPRPVFFFDVPDQGEGLSDIGTHLVDLAQWTLFRDQALDYRRDIQVQSGKRWATPITAAQFTQITGAKAFPAQLATYVHDGQFEYYCNNQVDYKIRGAQVRLKVFWNWESPAEVDLHHAIYRGTNASIEVRQTAKENYRPELFVAPNGPGRSGVLAAVRARLERLKTTYPGLGCESAGDELHITIPDRYRVGHEAHFAQVLEEFLKYLQSPGSMPRWEHPNMLAKYFVTTTGVQLSQSG
jgi:predicted dehydrogenase